MRYGVRVAPRAATQIRDAFAWWVENRPAAPCALLEDLDQALRFIRAVPHGGQPFARPEVIGTRRVHIQRSRYHLYYVPADDERVVIVLSLWHSARGEPPPL